MKYRALDNNGDMQFGHGIGQFHKDIPEAVAQAVMTRLKLFEGEWFINISSGVPYLKQVFGFGNISHYDFVIKQAILLTQGVSAILEYSSFTDSNRNATINATISTIYGQTTVNLTL